MEQESKEFLRLEFASVQTVILVVGCCAGPWGKPLALSGAELADSSNCISRSRSRFWTNYTNASKGNDFIFGPMQLKARSDANGVLRTAWYMRTTMLARVPGTFAGLLQVLSAPVVLDSLTVPLMCLETPHWVDELITMCNYSTCV